MFRNPDLALKPRLAGVLTAESRAGQYKHFDIENAAAHLHGMIDAKFTERARRQQGSTVGHTGRPTAGTHISVSDGGRAKRPAIAREVPDGTGRTAVSVRRRA